MNYLSELQWREKRSQSILGSRVDSHTNQCEAEWSLDSRCKLLPPSTSINPNFCVSRKIEKLKELIIDSRLASSMNNSAVSLHSALLSSPFLASSLKARPDKVRSRVDF